MVVREPNAFQIETIRALESIASRSGVVMRGPRYDGIRDTYAELECGSVKLWVYTDGACVIGPGIDRVFEVYDYDSMDELQRDFLDTIERVLNEQVT